MYRREPRAPSDDENRAKIDLQSGPDPSHPWSAESIVQRASGSDSASSSERDRAGDGSAPDNNGKVPCCHSANRPPAKPFPVLPHLGASDADRKSTRLNS